MLVIGKQKNMFINMTWKILKKEIKIKRYNIKAYI